jgi:hypothetical protein
MAHHLSLIWLVARIQPVHQCLGLPKLAVCYARPMDIKKCPKTHSQKTCHTFDAHTAQKVPIFNTQNGIKLGRRRHSMPYQSLVPSDGKTAALGTLFGKIEQVPQSRFNYTRQIITALASKPKILNELRQGRLHLRLEGDLRFSLQMMTLAGHLLAHIRCDWYRQCRMEEKSHMRGFAEN